MSSETAQRRCPYCGGLLEITWRWDGFEVKAQHLGIECDMFRLASGPLHQIEPLVGVLMSAARWGGGAD